MSARPLVALLLLASCGERDMTQDAPILITRPDQLDAAVGKRVTLQGEFVYSKIQTILGVDVNGNDLGPNVRVATASGVLQKSVTTKEDIDRAEKKLGGIIATRGPGTTYALVDPEKKSLARATAAR